MAPTCVHSGPVDIVAIIHIVSLYGAHNVCDRRLLTGRCARNRKNLYSQSSTTPQRVHYHPYDTGFIHRHIQVSFYPFLSANRSQATESWFISLDASLVLNLSAILSYAMIFWGHKYNPRCVLKYVVASPRKIQTTGYADRVCSCLCPARPVLTGPRTLPTDHPHRVDLSAVWNCDRYFDGAFVVEPAHVSL